MASPDIFALSHSGLNRFLFADIGPQDDVGTLTVASLFGRCGQDPWVEAERLAQLPAKAAASSLAAMIAGAPTNPRSTAEAAVIAERLVALLPRSSAAGLLVSGASPMRWPLGGLATIALVLGVLVALVAVWMAVADAGRQSLEDRSRIVAPFARESSL
jgi:hypothetical protein